MAAFLKESRYICDITLANDPPLVHENQVINAIEYLRRWLVNAEDNTSPSFCNLLKHLKDIHSTERVLLAKVLNHNTVQKAQKNIENANGATMPRTNPEVGSSRQSTGGLTTNSTPILVRLRSPPEIPLTSDPPTSVSAQASSPAKDCGKGNN